MNTSKNTNLNVIRNPHRSLRDLQQWFRWIVVDPRGVNAALKDPHPQTSTHPDRYVEPKSSARHLICGRGRIDAQERLSIYAEAYFSRLVETFEANFPTTKKFLNNDLFQTLICDYLKDYPSRTTNIDEVGRFLPQFVKSYSLQNDFPYLQEIVTLEWAVIESFYANDVPDLDVSVLSEVSEEQWNFAIMTLDPSVRLLDVNWPVDELWKDCVQGATRDPDVSSRGLTAGSRAQSPIHLCLHRCNGDVVVNRLQEYEFQILNLMRAEHTLSDIVQKIDIKHTQNIMNCFAAWVQSGIIKKITFKEEV